MENLPPADLSLRELADWAAVEAARLRENLPESNSSYPAFVLSQAAKLAEEVGELQAEVLGHAGFQRDTKGQFTLESIANELADVTICIALLAHSHGVDLGKALSVKMERVEARRAIRN